MTTFSWHRHLIQKVKDKYGLEEGMRVVHTVFTSFGMGIVTEFEVNSGEVKVGVEWANVGSFDNQGAKKQNLHSPGILVKIGKNDRSGPNQGFKVRKYLLNKDNK
jgi:hypothetical protein